MSPYRSPPPRPPPRVETMRVRRYPLAAQIFLAVWLPIVALATAEVFPNTTLWCTRSAPGAQPTCALDENTSFQKRSFPFDGVVGAVQVFAGGPDPLIVGGKSFDVPEVGARRVQLHYEGSLRTPRATSLSVPIRSLRWLLGLCSGAELCIFLFYFLAQVRFRLAADFDTGTLSVHRRRRLRTVAGPTLALADVHRFLVEDRSDDARGFAVVARMNEGPDELILESACGEARRAFEFLEHARQS